MKVKAIYIFLMMVFLSVSNRIVYADESLNAKLKDAVMFMDTEQVKTLLKQGADPNFKESDRPLIVWAGQNGSVEIVEALVNGKADINALDGIGQTALMRAVDMEQVKMIEFLVKSKADVNIKTAQGRTALTMAVSNAKPELVKILIDAGADPNVTNEDGDFPALMAVQEGSDASKKVVEILALGKANLNASNVIYTPLSYSVEQGKKDWVELLLKAGADPNGKTKDDRAPLILAMDNDEIFQILLNAKADPKITDSMGDSALMVAVKNNHPAVVEALIKAGADVNQKDASGNSPLMLANNNSYTEIVEILKKNGAQE